MTDNQIIVFVFLPIIFGVSLINMNDWIPRIVGRRKEDSKWASIIDGVRWVGILIMFLYFGITYLQQESYKIQESINNLQNK